MNGTYLLCGILFVSFVGMSCIVYDMIWNEESKVKHNICNKSIHKEKPIDNLYDDLDITADFLDDEA